jgi:hypothetical protein
MGALSVGTECMDDFEGRFEEKGVGELEGCGRRAEGEGMRRGCLGGKGESGKQGGEGGWSRLRMWRWVGSEGGVDGKIGWESGWE